MLTADWRLLAPSGASRAWMISLFAGSTWNKKEVLSQLLFLTYFVKLLKGSL